MNNSNSVSDNPVVVPLYENIVITIILLFALLANGLLISLFLRDHRMQTTTNFFVMSHIASEFFASCQGLVISIYVAAVNGRVDFAMETCIFISCENLFFFYASFLSLTAIAVNRYLAVVKQVHHKITAGRSKAIIGTLWLLSMIAALPWGSIFSGKPVRERHLLAWLVYCGETPAMFENTNGPASIFMIFWTVLCTGVTLVILLVCFYLILKSALRNRRVVSVSYNIHHVAADAYARSAFTTLVIIAVYLICNTAVVPLIISPSSASNQSASFVCRCIIWLRSATYPVVYILRNPVYFRLLRRKLFQVSSYCCQSCPCSSKDERTSYKRPQSPVARVAHANGTMEMQHKGRIQSSQCSSRESPVPANQQIRAWYLYKPRMAFTDLVNVGGASSQTPKASGRNLKSERQVSKQISSPTRTPRPT